MRKVLLFPWLWVALVNSAHAEIDFNSKEKPADAMSAEMPRTVPATRNWYAGGAIGASWLTGYDTTNANDAYYHSQGYDFYDDVPHGHIKDVINEEFQKVSWEGKVYGGYKLQSYMDVEMGYTRNDNWTPTNDYKNYSTNDTIKSERRIRAQAIYASVSFRPIQEGRGHGLYFKLGGHSSELKVSKTVTGTAANLGTIAAGDNLPYDGVSRGYGTLFGVGFDFKTARFGAVRLEWSQFNKLGGTPYLKRSLNIGYHGFF